MESYESYFETRIIIRLLCKYRIKQAKKKHKLHLLRDVSLHPKSIFFLHNRHNCPPDLKQLFPSRRQWQRPKSDVRKKYSDSQKLRIDSLYNTIVSTHIKILNGEIEPPDWYLKLERFIKDTQQRAINPNSKMIGTPIIKPIKKTNSKECKICRPISLYLLQDRIIITLASKYLTDLFDPYLHSCSYAFRSTKLSPRSHHDTISKIEAYLKSKKGTEIWVSECDIKKFFDCVNHKVILDVFDKFVSKVDKSIFNSNARFIFEQYLLSYSFNNDVFCLNSTSYFDEFYIKSGFFEWPKDELISTYYPEGTDKHRIGVPQGGAISCLIANLILHEVDEYVDDSTDADLLYIRFCDDMVILHNNREKCEAALERYHYMINKMNLLVHKPIKIENYNKDFWKAKSKNPYKWSSIRKGGIPWLSFVGYQIRYEGSIRIRKNSINKEIAKQEAERKEILSAMDHSERTTHLINDSSRKSRKQQIFALENRLISMSVGRINLYNYKTKKNGLCWTNGFKQINKNKIIITQLRQLDRCRNVSLFKFKKSLKNLTKESEKPDIQGGKSFFGSPYSYSNFLSRRLR